MQFCRSPARSQRSHWYLNDVGLPVHEPCPAVSVVPTIGVPSTVGMAVYCGGAALRAGAPAVKTTSVAAPTAASVASRASVMRFPQFGLSQPPTTDATGVAK